MLSRKQAIDQAIGRVDINQKDLSIRVGMSPPTLSKKLHNPKLFTALELERLNVVLRFRTDEMVAIVRGNNNDIDK